MCRELASCDYATDDPFASAWKGIYQNFLACDRLVNINLSVTQ